MEYAYLITLKHRVCLNNLQKLDWQNKLLLNIFIKLYILDSTSNYQVALAEYKYKPSFIYMKNAISSKCFGLKQN